MSNSGDAVHELREQLLLVGRTVSAMLCEMNYNLFLLFRTGEDNTSYVQRWKKKEEATVYDIFNAPTIEKALEIGTNFYKELLEYVKATKVDTADKAMDIAHSFIKKYSPVALPLKAIKEGDVWVVDIDVGALAVKVAKVKVDARTGDILSYEIPSKESKES